MWGRWWNYHCQPPKKHPKTFGPWKIKPSPPPAFDEEDMERIDEAFNRLREINTRAYLDLRAYYRDGNLGCARTIGEYKKMLDRLLG